MDPSKIIPFEHDFAHLFLVLEWVHRWFGKKDLAVCRIDLKLLVEGEVPLILHAIPSLHYSVSRVSCPILEYGTAN